MKKKCQVVMLPTKKESKLAFLTKRGEEVYKDLRYFDRPVKDHRDIDLSRPQHLYFVTDEEIKEGDWFIIINGHKNNNGIRKCYWIDGQGKLFIDPKMSEYWGFCKPNEVKKIVVSTDESLGLARPSNEFLKAYCEAYNSNPITEVNIEYNIFTHYHPIIVKKGIIDQIETKSIELKVAPDNTITISKVEEKMFTLEELTKLVRSAWYTGRNRGKYKEDLHPSYENEVISKWLKDKLK